MRLRIIAHTVLKQQPQQSSELAASDKVNAKAGEEFTVTHTEAAEAQHLKVVLAEPLQDNRSVWYVFQPHVEVIPEPEAAAEAMPAEADSTDATPTPGLTVSTAEADMTSNIGCGTAVAVLGALLLLLVPAVQLLNPAPNRINAWGWGALGMGLISTGFGSWLAVDALVAGRQAKRDRIQSTFFSLLETSNGEITVLQFARAANLSGEEAQKYLDTRAKEFNATFDVGSEGGIFYRFK